MSRNRLRNARPKLIFGSEEAAILAAAAINVAGTLGAAAIQKKATESAAKQQAEAVKTNAKTQADVIKEQTTRNAELMDKQIETTNKIHEEDKQAQRDLQMQLQLMQGDESLAERENESNIQLAKGGRISGNGLFRITDGGGAKLRTITPEGYPVYEFFGNDHKHYHKTKGGKYKSGVGVKLPNGGVVEAEGNQHSSTGELLYVSPNGYDFISDHSLGGITPADLVREGIHPEQAFAYQEAYKDAHGIADDGSKARNGKRCKRLAGGNSLILNDGSNPNMLPNTTTVGGTMFTYLQNQKDMENVNTKTDGNIFDGLKAKCGKRVRLRDGGRLKFKSGGATAKNQFDWGYFGPTAGAAGVSALGNLGAYFITAGGNNAAADILNDAYQQRADILTQAYEAMHGIDASAINREAFQPAHAMAALQSPRVYVGSQLGKANRAAFRLRKATNEGSTSSAARLARLNRIESDLAEKQSAIYDWQANQEGERAAKNADRITETSQLNAKLDSQSRRDLANLEFELAKYNNQIEMRKLLGIADAKSSAVGDSAEAYALAKTTNAGLLGSAIQSVGTGLSNLLGNWADYVSSRDTQYNELQEPWKKGSYLLGATVTPWSKRKYAEIRDLLSDDQRSALDKKFKWQDDTRPATTNTELRPNLTSPVKVTQPVSASTPGFTPAVNIASSGNATNLDYYNEILRLASRK